jgi:maleylpyruvate isomerase
MKLYGYWRSSSTWRVRIALAYKGIAYEYLPVHLTKDGGQQNTPAYQGLNPSRTVPLLEWAEEGKVRRLSQSIAIIEWLEEMRPSPALLPKEPFARATARMLAEWINSGIQPLQNAGVLKHLRDGLGVDEQKWAKHWIERGLTALEGMVAECAGQYCVGDEVSLADVYLIPQLYNYRRFGCKAELPQLFEIEARCQKLPAFIESHPDKMLDAEPA